MSTDNVLEAFQHRRELEFIAETAAVQMQIGIPEFIPCVVCRAAFGPGKNLCLPFASPLLCFPFVGGAQISQFAFQSGDRHSGDIETSAHGSDNDIDPDELSCRIRGSVEPIPQWTKHLFDC